MWPWGLVTSRFKTELSVYVYIKWGVGTGWVKKLFATWQLSQLPLFLFDAWVAVHAQIV